MEYSIEHGVSHGFIGVPWRFGNTLTRPVVYPVDNGMGQMLRWGIPWDILRDKCSHVPRWPL